MKTRELVTSFELLNDLFLIIKKNFRFKLQKIFFDWIRIKSTIMRFLHFIGRNSGLSGSIGVK